MEISQTEHLDITPACNTYETPPHVTAFKSPSVFSDTDVDKTFDKNPSPNNVFDVLTFRTENIDNVLFATLNVNSLPNKFDQIKTMIQGRVDILIITESKLDETFPEGQFYIGVSAPYRLDRNIHGGGVLIYVREVAKS